MVPLWGIDLGGTKIEGVVLDNLDDRQAICRVRVPTEQEKGYHQVLRNINKLMEVMASEVGMRPTKIGIGTPGKLDPKNQTLSNSNTQCLNGKPLKRDLETLLGIPVNIANDANCFALAETKIGTVAKHYPEAKTVFGVIMGTGVGGGLMVNGSIVGGRHGIAGEWGHNVLFANGPQCYCGKNGCVETYISGPAVERYFESLTGFHMSLKDIVTCHRNQENKSASQTIGWLLFHYGKAIAQVINILDPDVVVLGGGLSNIDELYTDGIEAIQPWIFNDHLSTVFLRPQLGDSAGVFGAALL